MPGSDRASLCRLVINFVQNLAAFVRFFVKIHCILVRIFVYLCKRIKRFYGFVLRGEVKLSTAILFFLLLFIQ